MDREPFFIEKKPKTNTKQISGTELNVKLLAAYIVNYRVEY